MPSALFSLYPRGDCFLLSDLGNIFYFIFSDSFGNNKQTHAYYTRAWPDSLLSFVRKPFFLPWPLFPRAQHASCHMSILYFTVKKISGISFLWALPLHLLLPFPLPLSVYFSDPPVLRLLQLSHLVIWGTFFSHLQLWAWEALLGLCLGAVPSCWDARLLVALEICSVWPVRIVPHFPLFCRDLPFANGARVPVSWGLWGDLSPRRFCRCQWTFSFTILVGLLFLLGFSGR